MEIRRARFAPATQHHRAPGTHHDRGDMSRPIPRKAVFAAALTVAAVVIYACAGRAGTGNLVTGDAAQRVYVAPGQYDEFYAFLSGGYNGQVSVYGLPSGRLLKLIPVFSQHAENGWDYNEETKAMFQTTHGFVPWDDTHHAELSQTD